MIRVLIVDHNRLTCNRSASLVGEQPDMEVIGCATNQNDAMDQIESCNLALISTNLPGDGAYELTRQVSLLNACTRVLIFGENITRNAVLRYIEAGALGFVCQTVGGEPLSEITKEDLLKKIRYAARGEALLPPDIAAALVGRLAELTAWLEEIKPAAGETHRLTRREREVLFLIGRDFTNQDIANHLIIEVGTVKNHVHNILAKLKVNSRREAAHYLSLTRDWPRSRKRALLSGSSEQYF